jgi:hypothetical protein
MDDDEYGALGGMTGKGSRRKPAPMPLSPPEILHNLTRV